MKILYLALVLFLVPSSLKAEKAFDPIDLYGEQIAFDVVREGKVVGKHITRFEKDGNRLKVSSHMNLDIFVLFLPVYAFDYQSTEYWENNRLKDMTVKVVDGSDKLDFTLKSDKNGYQVTLPDRTFPITGQLFSTNHWHSGVLTQSRVLNTLTGNLNSVTITKADEDMIVLKQGEVPATRYDYSGDLKDTSAWYDKQGRWVKLRFKARDGSMVEYKCTSCRIGEGS